MKQYVVDAFSDSVFHGNQAAVIIPDAWPSEELMMAITVENNFSETAFAVKEGEKYRLRWFTPGGEIDLCGHATLGTAFVLFRYYEPEAERLVFTTLSGDLAVTRRGRSGSGIESQLKSDAVSSLLYSALSGPTVTVCFSISLATT